MNSLASWLPLFCLLAASCAHLDNPNNHSIPNTGNAGSRTQHPPAPTHPPGARKTLQLENIHSRTETGYTHRGYQAIRETWQLPNGIQLTADGWHYDGIDRSTSLLSGFNDPPKRQPASPPKETVFSSIEITDAKGKTLYRKSPGKY